jgi:hypothetical protein
MVNRCLRTGGGNGFERNQIQPADIGTAGTKMQKINEP